MFSAIWRCHCGAVEALAADSGRMVVCVSSPDRSVWTCECDDPGASGVCVHVEAALAAERAETAGKAGG
jgi:hypothetical protein